MPDEIFSKLVSDGVNAIPLEFREKLDNVAVVIADAPTLEQLRNLPDGYTLFGLYEGIPLTKRNSGYSGFLPDKITIFKFPILSVCANEEEVKERVKKTVWHEIAHHFGMNEKEVRNAEEKR